MTAAPARARDDATPLPRVCLCGPIAEAGAAARGGYQACNRRSIEALRHAGIEVVALPYPHPHARGWRKQIEYALGFLRLYGRVLGCERGAILHLTALAAHFVYNEWPLLQLARLRGLRIVYDLRAGAGQTQYEARGAFYGWTFRSCLRSAHELLVEGEALRPFIERVARRAPLHLPNHIDTDVLPWRRTTSALPAAPTIAYVGRIVAEKGIETVLETARLLRRRGLEVRLLVAGDGDADYLNRLHEMSREIEVRWLGPLSSMAVLALWREAHFFVFPTRHVGEGQSNALTEAMACGCVPIASRHGFNQAVIGAAELTLPSDADAAAYAAAVRQLWPAAWPALSLRVQQRARDRFSTATALRTLLGVYRRAARLPAPAGEAKLATPPEH